MKRYASSPTLLIFITLVAITVANICLLMLTLDNSKKAEQLEKHSDEPVNSKLGTEPNIDTSVETGAAPVDKEQANEYPQEIDANREVAKSEISRQYSKRNTVMEVTAYCNCFECTGKHPGDTSYGITATGTVAGPGTIAADFDVFPSGTCLYIPGYGEGTVRDKGGCIKGNKLDVWFNSHSDALNWGRRTVEVTSLTKSTH